MTSYACRRSSPAALREHQRLARRRRRWMNASMFVITLRSEALPSGPTWKIATAHRLEEWPVSVGTARVTADDDGDLARRREVHAPGHRGLERGDSLRRRERREALHLVPVGRAHLDPGRALAQAS